MSDTAAVTDLKGGHAPALKVGGMRVVSKPRVSESEKPAEKTKEEGEEELVDEVVKDDKKALVSGAVTGEEEAFPKEAVKSFHEKPQPTHENKHAQKPKIIQQPRK